MPPDRAWLWIEARDYQRLFSYDMAALPAGRTLAPTASAAAAAPLALASGTLSLRLRGTLPIEHRLQGGGQAGVVKPVEGVVQDQWRFRYEGPAHCQAQGQVQLVSGSIAAPDQGVQGVFPGGSGGKA